MSLENHEVLCPTELICPICDLQRSSDNKRRIIELLSSDDLEILTKHFYKISISHTPIRETYHHFSLDTIKKIGRELVNGQSSLSSISNRKWWNMFVDAGVRYYSVEQISDEEYPIVSTSLIFYSEKDNLDERMKIQLHHRLRKICKGLSYSFTYIGKFNQEIIENQIDTTIKFNPSSTPLLKMGDDFIQDLMRLKEQRPIQFGELFGKKNSRNKILTP
jgi:hypothetical protein